MLSKSTSFVVKSFTFLLFGTTAVQNRLNRAECLELVLRQSPRPAVKRVAVHHWITVFRVLIFIEVIIKSNTHLLFYNENSTRMFYMGWLKMSDHAHVRYEETALSSLIRTPSLQ